MIKKCTITTAVFLCLLTFSFPMTASSAVDLVIAGLNQPVRLLAPPDDARLFVVQRGGQVRLFSQGGAELGIFLDISSQTSTSSERGLLGLAFAPDYATSGRFYIHYTNIQGHTRIARLTVDEQNPDQANPASQEIILAVDQPYGNHNGGHLEFGPDGMLYIGLGDGGSAGDPENRAQDGQSLLGKMLRLDVSTATGYAIPTDNPFVGKATRDEIWATGLRNPWCYAFDQATGDLYIADVGQGEIEEIDVQPAASGGGENYGWRLMEGPLCYNPATNCDDGGLTGPVAGYTHGANPYRCSISGGYVYRGSALPSLSGQYFYSDYCSKQIWSLTWTEEHGVSVVVDRTAEMTPSGGYGSVASFGQDGLGELYVLDLSGGKAYRIVAATSEVPENPAGFYLGQNYPNPFNPRTEIAFSVPEANTPVSLAVFDPAGRLVRTLVSRTMAPGEQVAIWHGRNNAGQSVESGLYLYRLEIGGVVLSRKMLLLE